MSVTVRVVNSLNMDIQKQFFANVPNGFGNLAEKGDKCEINSTQIKVVLDGDLTTLIAK